MSVNFKPTSGKILILIDQEEDVRKSKGGIIIPHNENLDPSVIEPKKASVMAVCSFKNEGGKILTPEMKEGDRVYINNSPGANGLKILLNEVVYNLIGEGNILGKFIE
jgi:co-chaperonin GroES (HSP10)